MDTPFDAFGDEVRKRMENPFWGSFIISWLLINWKVVYVTISWSSTAIDDKIIYIENLYGLSSFLEGLITISHLILLPLIASFIAVWWIPTFAREYLKKQIENKKQDDKLKIEEIKSEAKVAKEQIVLLEEQKVVKKLEKSREEIWDEEYIEIEKSGVIPVLVRFVFEDYGRRFSNNQENVSTYDLVNIIKYELASESTDIYELTDKGKYIIKKYPSDKLKDYFTDKEVPLF